MPGTRHTGGGSTGRAARRLAAVLFLPTLSACGGGGGDSGNAPVDSGQSNSPQTEEQRTKARAIEGGFQNAGSVSAIAHGSGTKAVVVLKSSSHTPTEATISNVSDCTENARLATPSQATVSVTDSGSEPAEFTLPTSSASSRPVCYTVTIGTESRDLQARGAVEGTVSPATGTASPGESTSGTGPSHGPTSAGGGETPYGGGGGTGTESGSTP
ncbi:hypothetical protein [Kitasatospora sp. NPDC086791]|uniref:hypothetical protein n=1 Tax=Kitasatospora sp. NPDC086791 TaxID=3155178 RepID=UPI003435A3F7